MAADPIAVSPTLRRLTSREIGGRLKRDGLSLEAGPFSFIVRSPIDALGEGLETLYSDNPVREDPDFADFHVSVEAPGGVRRFVRQQCQFSFDGFTPFTPLPRRHALPAFEWGLNWCIATNAHQYLLVHAAAIERDGRVAILPGAPGSGKSTLCAALVGRGGWRLLSDELTIVEPATGDIVPLARPVSLKNESIAIIREFVPGAVLSREIHDTSKGTVALAKAPAESVRRMHETARPGWIIFPTFTAGAAPRLESASKAAACLDLATNAFNYSIHGTRGFTAVADIVERCDCYRFSYSRLDDAIQVFAALAPAG